MGTLTVRNISDASLARFRVRAAEHGRSMEAEARAMIEEAARPEAARPGVAERVARARAHFRDAFGGDPPTNLVDDLLADRRAAASRGD